jgi:hypothetical protein
MTFINSIIHHLIVIKTERKGHAQQRRAFNVILIGVQEVTFASAESVKGIVASANSVMT